MPETIDYPKACVCNVLKNKIKQILLKYFECDDNGDCSSFHDPDYTAQNAIDDIHDIIGEI